MTIEEAVKTKLLADAGLMALLPGGLWPDAIPQGVTTWPAAAFEQSNGDNLTNVSGELNGLAIDSIDLTVKGPRREAVEAVRDYLVVNYSGIAARGTWGDKNVRACKVDNPQSTSISPTDASEKYDRQARLTLVIHWLRS